jgi:hypothetical protein
MIESVTIYTWYFYILHINVLLLLAVYRFVVAYLRTMSVSRLYSFDDRTIKEYGAVDSMEIGMGNRSTDQTRLDSTYLYCTM